MNKRFDRGVPKPTPPSAGFHRATFPEYNCGPIEFKKAKYYAAKCLELMGNPNDPASPSAAKWAHLRAQVQRVRRGEIEADDVYTSSENDNWVYAIHYTYVTGARLFLAAIEKWHTHYQPPPPLSRPKILVQQHRNPRRCSKICSGDTHGSRNVSLHDQNA